MEAALAVVAGTVREAAEQLALQLQNGRLEEMLGPGFFGAQLAAVGATLVKQGFRGHFGAEDVDVWSVVRHREGGSPQGGGGGGFGVEPGVFGFEAVYSGVDIVGGRSSNQRGDNKSPWKRHCDELMGILVQPAGRAYDGSSNSDVG